MTRQTPTGAGTVVGMDELTWCDIHGHNYKPQGNSGWSICRVCGHQVETGQSEETDEEEGWD
ncbi:MAG TPA: hypothetical protein VFT53_07585 [Candidatus Saccharimonadales bacterium]|nr:hypothetical protein [Candidatus Saccharimonadales bacterium]